MNSSELLAMAKEAGIRSAVLLSVYGNKLDALCDSELDELATIEKFAELIRNKTLEDAATMCENEAWRLKVGAVKNQNERLNSEALQAAWCAKAIRKMKDMK